MRTQELPAVWKREFFLFFFNAFLCSAFSDDNADNIDYEIDNKGDDDGRSDNATINKL